MMSMKESKKTSVFLPLDVIKGMNLVREKAKIYQSHQIELALMEYFTKYHKDVLKGNGIDLWKK